MPIRAPMMEERKVLPMCRTTLRQALPKASALPLSVPTTERAWAGFAAILKTSGMQKKPMSTETSSMPPCRSVSPMVKRMSPPMGAMPTVLSIMPMSPPAKPLISDCVDRDVMMVIPKTAVQKNSGGPKRSET